MNGHQYREQMNHAIDMYSRDYGVDTRRLEQLKKAVYDGAHRLSTTHTTFDADGTVFFARQLEIIESRIYRKKYAEYKARECIPVTNEGGEFATQYTYRVFDRVGEASIINRSNPTVIPIVDITAKEVTQKIVPIAIATEYSIFDIASAQKANLPLEAEKVMAMRDATERKIDRLAWMGDDDYGVQGLLTNSLIPTANVVNGSGGFPEWDTKTPSEILFDILDAIASILALTKDVEIPDTILLPTYQYNLLIQPRSDVSDTTLLKWLAENVPVLNGDVTAIKSIPFLVGQGVGGTDRMVVYRRDPEKLNLIIPFEFALANPVAQDLGYKISSRALTGGSVVRYPLSLTFRDSI
jgi:hypothetical protein